MLDEIARNTFICYRQSFTTHNFDFEKKNVISQIKILKRTKCAKKNMRIFDLNRWTIFKANNPIEFLKRKNIGIATINQTFYSSTEAYLTLDIGGSK